MNCLETQKRISAFLHGHLSDPELADFVEHMESCADCREELDFYLTMERALNDESSSEAFSFGNERHETEMMLKNASRRLWMRHLMRIVRMCFSFFLILTAGIMLLIYMERIPGPEHWGRILSGWMAGPDKRSDDTEAITEEMETETEQKTKTEQETETGQDIQTEQKIQGKDK